MMFRPTWFKTSRAISSSIGITITSAELALISGWELMDQNTMGSDHLPIISRFGRCLIEEPINFSLRLNFKIVNWIEFEKKCEYDMIVNKSSCRK